MQFNVFLRIVVRVMATTKTAPKTAVKKTAKPAKKVSDKEVVKVGDLPKAGSAISIIETGGKQYVVAEGSRIRIESMAGPFKEGDAVVFDKVLLSHKGSDTTLGAPYIDGAKVSAEITKIGRAPKVVVIKYKAKSRYFKKRGHRQPFFEVKITKVA